VFPILKNFLIYKDMIEFDRWQKFTLVLVMLPTWLLHSIRKVIIWHMVMYEDINIK